MTALALFAGAIVAVFVALLVLGLCAKVSELDARISEIEAADADASDVVDFWFAQQPAVVTDKGLDS